MINEIVRVLLAAIARADPGPVVATVNPMSRTLTVRLIQCGPDFAPSEVASYLESVAATVAPTAGFSASCRGTSLTIRGGQ